MCRWRHQAPLTVYENQNCDAAMLTHIRTEYSSCKGKETSRLWNLGFFFHSQSESFDINLSLKLESVVWKTPPLFKDSAGAPDNAGICISLFYLWFHGVLCIFLLFFFVFENGNTLCPGECSSGTDWGCTVKSLLVLPFMVSQFRHAPSCLVLLFIKYDRSNMISWKKKKEFIAAPPIYTPLHLTQTKIKIVCMDVPTPIWLTTASVFCYTLILFMKQ